MTLQLVGKRLKKSKRTVRAKSTVAVRGGKLRVNQLRVGSTRADSCPARANVVVTGASRATRKHRKVRRNAPVKLAPVSGCQVTVAFKLPGKLRRAGKVKVVAKGPGLKPARRTAKTR